MNASLVPLHLGGLHPAEQALVWLLAVGPFALLAVAVAGRRRQERRAERRQDRRTDRRPDGPAAQRDR